MHPYMFVRPGENGQGRVLDGFVIDLLDKLAARVGFKYVIRGARDAEYGSMAADGTWNGMIGELISGEADIAASRLTVTPERMRVVDFTQPFTTSRLAILMQRRQAQQNGIMSVHDLANQTAVRYGIFDSYDSGSASIEDFFRQSRIPVYTTMHARVDRSNPVTGIHEGIDRVVASSDDQPWALIAGSSLAELVAASRPACDLVAIDFGAYERGEAIAVAKSSPYKDRLDVALMELRQSYELARLHHKWWYPKYGCHQ